MFAPLVSEMDDDHFANANYNKNVECIIPTAELLVSFRTNGLRAKKPCFVYAEKLDFKGLIQLRLTEKCDQRRMYMTTVDSGSFHELKQDQSLHVTFGGFIENLVRILQDCQAGKLEINLVQVHGETGRTRTELSSFGSGTTDYQLQFVEMRAFKNLVHLCLPCRMAPLNVVLFYMNSILDAMQKKTAAQEQSAQQLQLELNAQIRRLEQLDAENVKLHEQHVANNHAATQRHTEELQQMQESLRKASEHRQSDNERNRKSITALQTQLDKLVAEKTNLQTEKMQEHKRCESLGEELASSKAHASSLKEQNEKLHAEVSALKNFERKNEMHLSDARKHIAELQDKLKKFEKSKADVNADLEAERKISQTKRKALEMATEEIAKANEIILKQSQELIKLKKTIGWRTEVALQQEKAINEKEKLLKVRDEEVRHMRQTIDGMRQEIPQQLDSMRKFANTLELKYSEQIKALSEKLRSTSAADGKENHNPLSIVKLGSTNRRK